VVPLLKDPAAPWEHAALTTHGFKNHGVRTEKWRYIQYEDGSEELYDETLDPKEWKNLAGDPQYASVKAEMARWLPKSNIASPKSKKEDSDKREKRARKGKKKS
jgi:hypothetical protein